MVKLMSTPGPTTSGRVLQLPWAAGERGERGRVEFQVAMRDAIDARCDGMGGFPRSSISRIPQKPNLDFYGSKMDPNIWKLSWNNGSAYKKNHIKVVKSYWILWILEKNGFFYRDLKKSDFFWFNNPPFQKKT